MSKAGKIAGWKEEGNGADSKRDMEVSLWRAGNVYAGIFS